MVAILEVIRVGAIWAQNAIRLCNLVEFQAIPLPLTNPAAPGISTAIKAHGPLAQLVEQVTLNHLLTPVISPTYSTGESEMGAKSGFNNI
jgi:hypothetical protein